MHACAGGRVIASPYARKVAAEAGVDIGQASGSGPGGRIVAADVQQLISSGGGKGAPAEAGAEPGKPHQVSSGFEVRRMDVCHLLPALVLQVSSAGLKRCCSTAALVDPILLVRGAGAQSGLHVSRTLACMSICTIALITLE